MLDKKIVYLHVRQELNEKLNRLQESFDELKKALNSETKSTAGDKHETGRAMAQLEQEKLSSQLNQLLTLKNALSKVDPNEIHREVQYGSLVKTNNGYFFFSIGLGKIIVEDQNVFCITATSPLGQKLLGKKISDSFFLNREINILDLV